MLALLIVTACHHFFTLKMHAVLQELQKIDYSMEIMWVSNIQKLSGYLNYNEWKASLLRALGNLHPALEQYLLRNEYPDNVSEEERSELRSRMELIIERALLQTVEEALCIQFMDYKGRELWCKIDEVYSNPPTYVLLSQMHKLVQLQTAAAGKQKGRLESEFVVETYDVVDFLMELDKEKLRTLLMLLAYRRSNIEREIIRRNLPLNMDTVFRLAHQDLDY